MQLLTVQEAAHLLRLSPTTIRRYIASGKLNAVRFGRTYRVGQRDIEQFAMRDPAQSGPEIGHELIKDSPLWELVGIMKHGPRDLAENHDKYLADAYGDHRMAGELPDADAESVYENLRSVANDSASQLCSPDLSLTAEEPVEWMKLGNPTSADNPLWNLIGTIDDDGPIDMASNHNAYLAEAYLDWKKR